jgi:hypothetical protein
MNTQHVVVQLLLILIPLIVISLMNEFGGQER